MVGQSQSTQGEPTQTTKKRGRKTHKQAAAEGSRSKGLANHLEGLQMVADCKGFLLKVILIL